MSAQTLPVAIRREWLCEPLPTDAALILDKLTRSDDVVHVAVMPDVHVANEICVGTVAATSRLIYVNAVGGDIGCGMAAVAFDCEAEVLQTENAAARLLEGLYRAVSANRRHVPVPWPGHLERALLSDPALDNAKRRDGRVQLGTLGGGNHFLEFQADEAGQLWLMVHSGSRAMGQAIRSAALVHAALTSTGLRALEAESPPGQAYLVDAAWAVEYAIANRRAMVEAAAGVVERLFSARVLDGSYLDCVHNYVRREEHFGRLLWVHRKGAMSADLGEPGIIPGSMGTRSFHVEGRGCIEALRSSSHGAGRALSRHKARDKVSTRLLHQQMRGVWFDHRLAGALREEAPAAYKDIGAVIRAQKDLTRVVRTLRPVLCYKGA